MQTFEDLLMVFLIPIAVLFTTIGLARLANEIRYWITKTRTDYSTQGDIRSNETGCLPGNDKALREKRGLFAGFGLCVTAMFIFFRNSIKRRISRERKAQSGEGSVVSTNEESTTKVKEYKSPECIVDYRDTRKLLIDAASKLGESNDSTSD